MNAMIPDPHEPDAWLIGSAAEPSLGVQTGATVLHRVHPAERCAGQPCVVHAPSNHHMHGWPLNWRGDRRIMERICPHGIGHPDPDEINPDTIHGCDGCCWGPA